MAYSKMAGKKDTKEIETYQLDYADPLVDRHDLTNVPPILRSMSDVEIKKLGSKTTMKLDLVIMPALTVMYILNYLG